MLYSKFQKISRACSRNFTQFHAIFTQFWLFQPFLGQFQHVGYQKACTRAKKFIGNTFKKFHARVHAISRNFHAIWTISAIFGQFQHVGYQKAYTRAEKFIGGIGRGHRPQEGVEGPKEEAEGLQTGPKAP